MLSPRASYACRVAIAARRSLSASCRSAVSTVFHYPPSPKPGRAVIVQPQPRIRFLVDGENRGRRGQRLNARRSRVPMYVGASSYATVSTCKPSFLLQNNLPTCSRRRLLHLHGFVFLPSCHVKSCHRRLPVVFLPDTILVIRSFLPRIVYTMDAQRGAAKSSLV